LKKERKVEGSEEEVFAVVVVVIKVGGWEQRWNKLVKL